MAKMNFTEIYGTLIGVSRWLVDNDFMNRESLLNSHCNLLT